MRTLVLLLIVCVVTVLAVATAALGDPDLSNVPAHRHYIETATGELVQVGPRFCDNPSLQTAFNQFHNNTHVVTATGIGPAAPGLHNAQGAELMFGPC
jgi:hypothetical protein